MKLSPIALFVYNRPEHTTKTLRYLSCCDLAHESDLYIFADGPKVGSTPECLENIKKVREIISNVDWPNRLEIITRDTNAGLAKSIVDGVTDLCEKFGRVIVLEDDLLVNKFFLKYMNAALDKYENCLNVYQISAYMFPVHFKCENDAFFLPLTTTWGWATWDRAWKIFNWDPVGVWEKLNDKKIRRKFDLDGAYSYSKMLLDRLNNKNNSWGILFWWAVFNANGLVLHPKKSLVENIGFDGSGTNCSKSNIFRKSNVNNTSKPLDNLPNNVIIDIRSFSSIKTYLKMNRNRIINKIKSLFNKCIKKNVL